MVGDPPIGLGILMFAVAPLASCSGLGVATISTHSLQAFLSIPTLKGEAFDCKSVSMFLLLVAWLSASSASVLVVLSRSSALVYLLEACFATLLIAAHVLVVSGDAKLRFKMSRELLLSAISGVFLAAHFLTWMESLFYIPVSLSTTIVVTYPLLAMLYEAILGISKPTKEEIVGAVMPSLGWL